MGAFAPACAGRVVGCLVGLLAVGASAAPVPASAVTQPPSLSHWRALVVGIDRGAGPPETRGAEASAADLTTVLRAGGSPETVLLAGATASREAFDAALDRLVRDTGRGEVALLAFDGLGLPEAHPASDSLAMSLRLVGAGTGRRSLVTGADLARFVRAVEARGGRALLVADALFGAPRPRPASGSGEPAADGGLAGASAAPLFERSLVLAAGDLRSASPAAPVPGRAAPARLLTYAVARALEGRASPDPVGPSPFGSLVPYVARLVYQLSAGRQQIAALSPHGAGPAEAERTRGIVIKPTAVLGASSAADPIPPAAAAAAPVPSFPEAGRADQAAGPIRLAAATGTADRAIAMAPGGTPVVAVARTDEPDLIWDPIVHNVLSPGGDVLADEVDEAALGHVIERAAAMRRLQALIVDAPQQVVLLPDDGVKPRGSLVTVEVGDVAGRSLILFNIRSDGKVQTIYPRPGDPPLMTTARYTLPLRVSDPIGADAIVVVTGSQRLPEIEKGLTALNGLKQPVAAVKLIHDLALPGTLVGAVQVFSNKP